MRNSVDSPSVCVADRFALRAGRRATWSISCGDRRIRLTCAGRRARPSRNDAPLARHRRLPRDTIAQVTGEPPRWSGDRPLARCGNGRTLSQSDGDHRQQVAKRVNLRHISGVAFDNHAWLSLPDIMNNKHTQSSRRCFCSSRLPRRRPRRSHRELRRLKAAATWAGPSSSAPTMCGCFPTRRRASTPGAAFRPAASNPLITTRRSPARGAGPMSICRPDLQRQEVSRPLPAARHRRRRDGMDPLRDAGRLFDNLIADKGATPMIVVIPNGRALADDSASATSSRPRKWPASPGSSRTCWPT